MALNRHLHHPVTVAIMTLRICLLLQYVMVITVFDSRVLIAVTKVILVSNLQLHLALTKGIMIVSLYRSLAAKINMKHILYFHPTKDLTALCLPFVSQVITNTTRPNISLHHCLQKVTLLHLKTIKTCKFH